jgi:hypothetical protein
MKVINSPSTMEVNHPVLAAVGHYEIQRNSLQIKTEAMVSTISTEDDPVNIIT